MSSIKKWQKLQWKTNTVTSVTGGSDRIPDSISLDLVLRSMNAPSTYFKILYCSFTSSAPWPEQRRYYRISGGISILKILQSINHASLGSIVCLLSLNTNNLYMTLQKIYSRSQLFQQLANNIENPKHFQKQKHNT